MKETYTDSNVLDAKDIMQFEFLPRSRVIDSSYWKF